MRQPSSRIVWVLEAEYIEGIDPQRPGRTFNNDPNCFARYTRMKSDFAREDDCADLADRMLAHVPAARTAELP